MDKQINLYRNVFAKAQHKRAVWSFTVFAIALLALISWAAFDKYAKERAALSEQSSQVDAMIKTERLLLSAATKELKTIQSTGPKEERPNWDASIALLRSSSRRNEFAAVLGWLTRWDGAGARIKKIGLDKGMLSIAGESLATTSGLAGLNELEQLISSTKGWVINRKEMKTMDGSLIEFSIAATYAAGGGP